MKKEMEDYLVRLCDNKKVLDVGFAGNNGKLKTKPINFIHNISKEYSCIDIQKRKVNFAVKKGYDAYLRSVEDFDLKTKFDVILLLDVIEHLSNIGNALECIKKHMTKNSILVVNTPNAHYLFGVGRYISLLRNVSNINKEHTVWFCPITIKQLFERHGFIFQQISSRVDSEIFGFGYI